MMYPIPGLEEFAVRDTNDGVIEFGWSSALRADGPCVWMRVESDGDVVAVHLNVKQLRALRAAVGVAAQAARKARTAPLLSEP